MTPPPPPKKKKEKKNPQNLHTLKNIHFSENPKNIEIQDFEPQIVRAYIFMKISEYPLGFGSGSKL